MIKAPRNTKTVGKKKNKNEKRMREAWADDEIEKVGAKLWLYLSMFSISLDTP